MLILLFLLLICTICVVEISSVLESYIAADILKRAISFLKMFMKYQHYNDHYSRSVHRGKKNKITEK